jgi:hypothetical protein
MGGGQILRHAPLLVLAFALCGCQLKLDLNEPSYNVEAKLAYSDENNIAIDFAFIADESALRCRYTVNSAASGLVRKGFTGEFKPGTPQQLKLSLDPVQGAYSVDLVAQAPRSSGYVDLPFLTNTVAFYLDLDDPSPPDFDPGDTLIEPGGFRLFLTHPELSDPDGTPVSIHYTLSSDGSQKPDGDSPVYDPATGIVVPLDSWELILRAVAIDESLRSSLETVVDPVYDDADDPDQPVFSQNGGLFTDGLTIHIEDHPEWTVPQGSLVRIYYTTDGSIPSTSSPQYTSGLPISILKSGAPATVKAVAIDDSGRQSGVASQIYRFLDIQYVTTLLLDLTQNTYNTNKQDDILFLHGYGFENVISVDFRDWDNTAPLKLTITLVEPILVKVTVDLGPLPSQFTGNGTSTKDGTVVVHDASGVSDSILIDLTP